MRRSADIPVGGSRAFLLAFRLSKNRQGRWWTTRKDACAPLFFVIYFRHGFGDFAAVLDDFNVFRMDGVRIQH